MLLQLLHAVRGHAVQPRADACACRDCGRPRACAKRINQGALSAGRGHCKDMGCWLVTGGLGRRVQAGGTKSSAARSRWTAARAGGWRTSSALRPPMRMANTGHGCFTRCPSRWVRRRPPWQALGADTGPASLTQLSALLCMQDCVSARGSRALRQLARGAARSELVRSALQLTASLASRASAICCTDLL